MLEETGLLPHVNAGALGREDLSRVRAVSPSQGMMIESLNPELAAHRGAPDKDPERRLATLRMAGELSIPFTTGVLVGIGETRADRVVALEAIATAHRDFDHVQEVIVQNFRAKPGTKMATGDGYGRNGFGQERRLLVLARTLRPSQPCKCMASCSLQQSLGLSHAF